MIFHAILLLGILHWQYFKFHLFVFKIPSYALCNLFLVWYCCIGSASMGITSFLLLFCNWRICTIWVLCLYRISSKSSYVVASLALTPNSLGKGQKNNVTHVRYLFVLARMRRMQFEVLISCTGELRYVKTVLQEFSWPKTHNFFSIN